MKHKERARLCGRWLSMLSLVPLALLPLVGLWLARMAAQDGMTEVYYDGNHTNWKFYRPGRILLDLLVNASLWAFAFATAVSISAPVATGRSA